MGLGRWTTRDPLLYVDGSNLYQNENDSPTDTQDPAGLAYSGGGGYGAGGFRKPKPPIKTPNQVCGALVSLYTGSWCSTQDTYNAAVDAAGQWLQCNSPVRGGFLGAGYPGGNSPSFVQGGGYGSWTIDEGGGGGGEFLVGGQGSNGYGGAGGGVAWSQGGGWSVYNIGAAGNINGYGGGEIGWAGGTDGQITLGIYEGPVYGGLLIDPSKFPNLWNWYKNKCGCGSH